jgi:hypothetical protein
MRKASFLALALGLTGFAGSASAWTQACDPVTGSISTNTTWTKAGAPYILPGACFVENGAILTIQPGVVVRWQPRTANVTPGTIAGTPGSLIVTSTGKIQAVGTPAEPIIFTTAAIDQNGDNPGPAAVLCTLPAEALR